MKQARINQMCKKPRRKKLYKEYKEYCKKLNLKPISLATFQLSVESMFERR